jgi:hypothetical protein
MALRAILAVAAAAAIVVGFCLPVSHGRAAPKSQIEQIEIGRG